MHVTTTILSLLIAAAGWYYMFYSRAAERLADAEAERVNQRRIRLRRFGGGAMMAMGVCFFAGFHTINAELHPIAFVVLWLTVFLLLGVVVLLALLDLRLTMRLRQRALSGKFNEPQR